MTHSTAAFATFWFDMSLIALYTAVNSFRRVGNWGSLCITEASKP